MKSEEIYNEMQEHLRTIYDDYCEHHLQRAPKEVSESYLAMQEACDEHFNAVCEHYWKQGFLYALKLREEQANG